MLQGANTFQPGDATGGWRQGHAQYEAQRSNSSVAQQGAPSSFPARFLMLPLPELGRCKEPVQLLRCARIPADRILLKTDSSGEPGSHDPTLVRSWGCRARVDTGVMSINSQLPLCFAGADRQSQRQPIGSLC